jgi:hypothetical protein
VPGIIFVQTQFYFYLILCNIRVPDPSTFSLPVLWSGDRAVTCQRSSTGPPTHANAGQAQDSASGANAPASPGGTVTVSVRSVLVEMAVLQATNNVINLRYDTYTHSFLNYSMLMSLQRP